MLSSLEIRGLVSDTLNHCMRCIRVACYTNV